MCDVVEDSVVVLKIGFVIMGMFVVFMVVLVFGGFLEEIWDWCVSFWLMFGFGSFVLVFVYFDLGEIKNCSGFLLGV